MSVFWKYNTASGLESSLQAWIQLTFIGCLSTLGQALLQMFLILREEMLCCLSTGRAGDPERMACPWASEEGGARSLEICLLQK